MSDVSDDEKSQVKNSGSSKDRKVGDNFGRGMEVLLVYRLTSSDSTGIQIIGCTLTGDNYLIWSRAMLWHSRQRTNWPLLEVLSTRDYYGKLKLLWDKLEFYLEQSGCSCGASAMITAKRETKESYQFLMGLTFEFNTIRSTILSIEPMPNLNKVYKMVANEERQKIMTQARELSFDAMAFLAKAETRHGREVGISDFQHTLEGKRDRTSRRTLGVSELRGGIYYLRRVEYTLQACQAVIEEPTDIWHQRLGHPSRTIKMNDTQQQNGRVERKHRHILNVARALMFQASLPTRFWGECVLIAVHLINITSTPLLGSKSPHEILFGKTRNYSNLQVFGSLCYAHIRTQDKFAPRSRKCIFIGYPHGKKGWRLYNLKDRHIFVSRDIQFCKMIFPSTAGNEELKKEMRGSPLFLDEHRPDFSPDDDHELEPSMRKSTQSNGLSSQKIGVGRPFVREGLADKDRPKIGVGWQQNTSEVGVRPADEVGYSSTQKAAQSRISPTRAKSKKAQEEGLAGRDPEVRGSPRKLAEHGSITEPGVILGDPEISQKNYGENAPMPISSTENIRNSSGMSYPIEKFVDYLNISYHHKAFLAAIDSDKEPTSYREAVRDRRWRIAMAKEIKALALNKNWMIEQLPHGKRPIDCKWVYKVKRRADGSIERYKARLVAKGFTQVEGIDYHETLAPVAKLEDCAMSIDNCNSKGVANTSDGRE
ncbi:hypothetical protein CRG98_003600 [Punica granatum]|uniref:Uncharacterized protein n=1 Tax=Punica granatum TaxID=22663 RepID=A0A2I0L607_PUNGR|nr:hypothetical protein CRG98_003600 [Punica granatum]